MIDCVYIAAGGHDLRFTRICIASVRFFYPDIPIRLLSGGRLRRRFLREVKRIFNVEMAAIPAADYGWGFIKLEPLFQTRPEQFLMLDSDTALLGPVLEFAAKNQSDFIVDCEEQPEERAKEIYFDWESAGKIDPGIGRPKFLFNTGQWFGRSKVLDRNDFGQWVKWSMPRQLSRPDIFKNGEQGILNFVINKQAQNGGLTISRVPLMRWPGFDVADVELANVMRGLQSPYRAVMHWAGFKAAFLESLPRFELLLHFERFYYKHHWGGERLCAFRAKTAALEYRSRELSIKLVQRFQRLKRT